MPECTDERIAIILADYWSGHLSEADRHAVEEHLKQCEPCRKSLKAMNLIAGVGIEDTGREDTNHISNELLTAYHSNPESLDASVIDRVHRHLQQCPACSHDLAFTADLEVALRESVSSRRSPVAAVGLWDQVRALFLKPAVALPLLIILVILAGRWFRPSHYDTGMHTASTSRIRLKESRRSGGESTRVYRDAGTNTLLLDLPYYASRDATYNAIVFDSSGTATVPVGIGLRLGDNGTVSLHFDPRGMKDGDYNLMLMEISGGAPADTTRSYFPFHLITQDASR
jgi:hypothetical protein